MTLTAVAQAGSRFTGWSGGGCAGTGTCQVTMNAATAVAANFVPVYTLTVSKTGTGTGTVTSDVGSINCGATCADTYDAGTLVTLTAGRTRGSRFTGWSGGGCAGTGTCQVTMNAAAAVAATFVPVYTLTVSKTGAGTGTVTSDVGSINCGATCADSYDAGTLVTLTAAPQAGSRFTGWSGGGCAGTGTCQVTMNAATAVAANFVPTYALTVSKTGAGTGTVTSDVGSINCGATCVDNYDAGTVVTLTAVAQAGSRFTGWSGGGCAGTGTCQVTMNAATAVAANFVPVYALTVSKSGAGTGTVTSNVGSINCGATCADTYDAGTVVVLSAVPDATFVFVGWSGGGCAGTGTCQVTMNAATAVTATFAPSFSVR